jgi:gliding motility-associated-like protein
MRKHLINNWKSYVILLHIIFATELIFANSPEKLTNSKPQGFIKNLGQVSDEKGHIVNDIKYYFKGNGATIFIFNNKLSYQFIQYKSKTSFNKISKNLDTIVYDTYRLDVELVGTKNNPDIINESKLDYYENFYNQNFPNGLTNVPSYEKIIIKDVYPNIDWVIYSKNGTIKYDFVVRPGGDPHKIKLLYKNHQKIEITDSGELEVNIYNSIVKEAAPISIQNEAIIPSSFDLKQDTLSFKIKKHNNKELLTIDPTIEWSTFFGGTSDDTPYAIATDYNNNPIIGGYTISASTFFTNTFQTNYGGGTCDAFISKFNQQGFPVYSTYYGGSDYDAITDIATTTNNDVFFIGYTKSTNGIAFQGYQNQIGGGIQGINDAFLVKFSNQGYRIWGTYFGGSGSDDGLSLTYSDSSHIYITGSTTSAGISFNYPNSSLQGNSDGFVAKYDTSGTLLWSRYLGGNGQDNSWGISVNNLEEVYITGITLSTNNIATQSAYQNNLSGQSDGYLIKLDNNGNIIWGTYFGGSSSVDYGYNCVCDNVGNIYLTGVTFSANNISYNGFQNNLIGPKNLYLAKFNSTGSRIWSSYFGAGGEDVPEISMDLQNNIFLNGTTDNPNIPIINPFNQFTGNDVFLAKFDTSCNLIWSSFIGIGNATGFNSVAPNGAIYIAGSNFGGGFSLNAYQSLNNGTYDNFLMKLFDPNTASPNTLFSIADTSFCTGTCVNFTNQSTRDSSWLWLFPGGTPTSSTLQTPPQVCYNTPGTYSVTLITSNAFGSDTLILPNYITVDPSPTAQIITNISTCEGTVVNLTSSGGTSYAWSGPNGFTSNLQNPTITNSTVTNSGTYSVVVANSVGCTDTATTQININAVTPALANSNSPLCVGQALNLTSNTASTYSWSGPNGFTSTLQNPSISNLSNNNSGTYTLIVANGNGCADTTTLSISVLANNPVSINSNGPLCTGQTLNLTASNGSSYSWSGPNGFTSSLQNPTINNVVVNNAGSYAVVVTNSNGCTNFALLTVSINPNTPITASSNSPICEGDNLTMNVSAGSTYSWTGPNGFTSSIQNPTISNITTTSSGLYSATVTNACGTGSSNTQVQVGQKPNAAIAVTQTVICEGDTVYLIANGGNSYYWYGPNGFNSILSTPTVTNFSSANIGEYYLVATNNANCSDTTVVNLTLNESTCFFIPSVFTPNNDGTNDTWVIEGLWQFPNCIVKVYNRWGQSLFESKGYASPWYGTFEGNECPIADYYYIIDLKNGSRVFTGTITIKR